MPDRKVQVLVVEDSPTEALRLKYAIENNGWSCGQAGDGDQGLAFVREHKPAVVITDVMMPGMDGFELCRRIKEDRELQHIRVILQTSLSETRNLVRGLEARADYYFTKPADPVRLVSKVQALMAESEDRHALPTSGLSITIDGRKHVIDSDPQGILNLMVATYENAAQQNEQLMDAERRVQEINAQLEDKLDELAASEQRFRRAIIDAPYPAMIHTIDGEVMQVSKAWCELSGVSPDEITCVDDWIDRAIPPAEREAVKAYFAQTFRLRRRKKGKELTLLSPLGTERIWECSASPLGKLADGRLLVISMASDVTNRNQAEKAIREACAAAEATSRAKSDFLASMSHELRTPLNTIIGFSELLKEGMAGDLTEQQAEFVGDILDSGTHLLSLINDVLDLAKVEAGKMDLAVTEIDIAALIEQSLVMVKEKCLKHDIELTLDVQPDAASTALTGDERRLKQVMFNLLSNAVKFTHDGGHVRVTARLLPAVPAEADGKLHSVIEIAVQDDGIGIAPEHMEHLFEEFYQVHGGLANKTAGTGLGLPLARNLVEMHGGGLWGESEGKGEGATFKFTLPVTIDVPKNDP